MTAHRSLGRVVACFALLEGCNAITGASSFEVAETAPDSTSLPDGTNGSSARVDSGATPLPRPSADASLPSTAPSKDGGDAKPDAGQEPARVLHVFVTSTKSGSSLGGTSGADAICRDRAASAGRSGKWVAWLSSGGDAATARITANGPWRTFDETIAVSSRAELTGGAITHAIDVDETGAEGIVDDVWTGTNARPDAPGATDCAGWKGFACVGTCPTGTSGRSDAHDTGWTSAGKNGCLGGSQRLYCFET